MKTKDIIIVKRCKFCKKILREYNKSGVCSACRNSKRFIINKSKLKDVNKM